MKIGIITMHRVQNVGSILQAYALQHKIEQLGHKAELIDYVFPPIQKESISFKNIVSWGIDGIQGFPSRKRYYKYESFREQLLHCSPKQYTRDSLLKDPPKYDIYCTGSDQVWNPQHVGKDTSFMLDFINNGSSKISFASSFATNEVSEPYFSLYASNIKKYSHITVREQSGVEIVKKMTGKEATTVCDPTLLLTADEWSPIANRSNIKVPNGYILVYLLRYMFDPRPGFYNIVEFVRHALQLPVYQYNPYTRDSFRYGIRSLRGMGPEDFINLIKNASFVVTDSFHGVAFSTVFNKPVIGVIKDSTAGDGRIATLRKKVGGENSIVFYDQQVGRDYFDTSLYKCDDLLVDKYRKASIEELKKML